MNNLKIKQKEGIAAEIQSEDEHFEADHFPPIGVSGLGRLKTDKKYRALQSKSEQPRSGSPTRTEGESDNVEKILNLSCAGSWDSQRQSIV